MTCGEVLARLEQLGSAKVKAIYTRASPIENVFGVKLGDLRTIAKQIGANHPLALELWGTRNLEAMLLATLVLSPKKLSSQELDQMVHETGHPHLADWAMTHVVKNHPASAGHRVAWMDSANPYAARAGWSLTANAVARGAAGLDPAALLDRIEREMPDAPAPAQWTMNFCLAHIGIYVPELRERALAMGEAMGVYRDYPVSKGCTSPFAPIWISEMVRRQAE